MNSVHRITPALLCCLSVLGCAADDGGAAREQGEQVASTEEMAGFPPEMVQHLMAEYAVLGSEPIGQPTPEGRDAGIPERVTPSLPETVLEVIEGEATFYADSFEGRRTASGIPFRQNQFVAAHRAYPFGTLLRVTNLRNDRSVNVRVVDRGPHGARARARNTVIDLSRRAAEALDYTAQGRTPVRVEVLEWGEGLPQTS